MKLLFFSNIPSPYFVEYLNELSKYVEIIAVFEKENFAHRDKSWKNFHIKGFEIHFLKGIRIGKIMKIAPSALKFIKNNRDARIIITNPLTYVGMMCIEYCRIKKIPYALQSEGGIPKDGKGLKEKIKRHFLCNASLYLSGMKKQKDYFEVYGADSKKIIHYPFASLHEDDLILEVPDGNQKKQLRDELHISCDKMVLFVGRIIQGKGIDTLIQACQDLPDDTKVIIVGGYATDSLLSLSEQLNMHNLLFVPHVPLEELKKYYMAADLFVLPTRGDTWGLVINEAMSYGLPVITTTSCVAGNELIEDGVNGYLFHPEDRFILHDRIAFLLNHPEVRRRMGKLCKSIMNDYTYENMAKVIFSSLLDSGFLS